MHSVGVILVSLELIVSCALAFNLTSSYSASTTTMHTVLDNVTTIATSLPDPRGNLTQLECVFAPGLIVGSREKELECCDEIFDFFYRNWAFRSMSLTTFLQTLRQWNCPQYKEQCSSRVFAFTDFSKLVYDYFCNYTLLVENCLPEVLTIVEGVQKRLTTSFKKPASVSSTKPNSTTNTLLFEHENLSMSFSAFGKWENVVSIIKPSDMTLDELLQPCIQIAQYDQVEVFDGSYQEIIGFPIPTCEISQCGFSAEAFRSHRISFWSCFSPK